MPLSYNYRSSSSDQIHLGKRNLSPTISSLRGSSDSSLIPNIRGTTLNSQPSLRSILAHDDMLLSTFLDSPYRQASKPHPFVALKENKTRSGPASLKSRRSTQNSPQTSPRLPPSKSSNRRPISPPAFIPPKIIISPCDHSPRTVTEAGAAIMPKSIDSKSLLSPGEDGPRFRRIQAASERRAQIAPKFLSNKSSINWENIDLEKMRLSFNPLTKESKLINLESPDKKQSRKKTKSQSIPVEPLLLEDLSLLKDLESIWSESIKTLTSSSPLSSQASHETTPSSTQKESPLITPQITCSNEKSSKRWKFPSLFSIFRPKSTKSDIKLSKSPGVLPCPPNLVYTTTPSEKPRSSKRFSKQMFDKFLPKSRPLSVQ